jgi:predicted anti-sigma-YlaC factor YlaD
MPLIREHLDNCSECCEEYEALLDVVEKTDENQS